jgi:hypothetical protein
MAFLKSNNSKKHPDAVKASTNGMSSLYQGLANYQFSQNRWIPLSIIGLLCLNFLAQCGTQRTINNVQRQDKYAFLQRVDGNTERIEQVNSSDRSVATIKKFTYDWFKLCHEWGGKFDRKPDPGITIGGKRFPSVFGKCAYAIAPDFRQTYLSGFYDYYANNATLKPLLTPSLFTTANTDSKNKEVLIYVEPLEPKTIQPGVFEIPVVATREVKIGDLSYIEKFNKLVRLKAIPPYLPPWTTEDQTPLGKLLGQWQLQGLQIVNISNYRQPIAD